MSTFYCNSEEHGNRYVKACEVFQNIICCACCPANDCEDSEFPNDEKEDRLSLAEFIQQVEEEKEKNKDFE